MSDVIVLKSLLCPVCGRVHKATEDKCEQLPSATSGRGAKKETPQSIGYRIADLVERIPSGGRDQARFYEMKSEASRMIKDFATEVKWRSAA